MIPLLVTLLHITKLKSTSIFEAVFRYENLKKQKKMIKCVIKNDKINNKNIKMRSNLFDNNVRKIDI